MKPLLTMMIGVAAVATLSAKPAFRGPIERELPDGSKITVYQHGDEFFHWMTNEQGEWLEQNTDGTFKTVPALSDDQITARRQASPLYMPQAQQQAAPINLEPRGLVILVNFQDRSFSAENTRAVMRDMHNGENYKYNYSFSYGGTRYNVKAEGSVRQYFIDQSCGQYQPHFDVVGPFTVSRNMAYYGGNTSAGSDKNAAMMIQEACEMAHESGINFANYDNNDDGKVDFVYVVYAGYGEADGGEANTIWPHSWHLSYGNITLTLDGKRVDLYACGSELNAFSNKRAGIATFCHEFSHVLGLPDLYTTNNAKHKTCGSWDIMDYGSYNNDGNTPPAYSAYERMFFGWANPRILNNGKNVTIKELQANNDVCVMTDDGSFNGKGNNPSPTEFYTLEYRQQTGWDRYIKGHGMMITKIAYSYNKWSNNSVNNISSSMGVDLIEADGKAPTANQSGYDGKSGDLFPRGATEFKTVTLFPVTEIAEADNTVTFKVCGGGPESIIEIVHPTAITMSQTELTLTEKEPEATLTAIVEPSDVTFKDVIWTSSNINVATVHNGTVTALKRGEAVISATTHRGTVVATAKVICNLPEAINNVAATRETNTRKVFENGQVIIIRDGMKYTLLGERIE